MPKPISLKGKTFTPRFEPRRFKELMLFIADRSQGDPDFGATKLNKILFFSDFFAYGMFGKSITGATYQRLEKGPAPKQLLPCRNELIESKRAELIERQRFNRSQKRLIAKDDANISIFTPEEIALVEQVIERMLDGKTATQTSDLSHQICLGWKVAGDRQEIPYEAVFLSTEPMTPSDVRVGLAVAKRHGKLRAS